VVRAAGEVARSEAQAEPMNPAKMSSVECSFKSLTAPHLGDLLQSQNSLTFKLLKTGKWRGPGLGRAALEPRQSGSRASESAREIHRRPDDLSAPD
jgi:hypothetical protein